MKKLYYAFIFCFLFTGFHAWSQQLPQFSHYSFNGMYISPGYAGISGQAEVTAIYRLQWFGYQGSFDEGGAPNTGLFSASLPIRALRGGIGLHFVQDQLGATTVSNGAVSYSQHVKLGNGKLGIGVQGIVNRISKGEYRYNDIGDPSVPFNSADSKFDVGAGLWYQADKFYLGSGINNLLRSNYVLEDEQTGETPDAGDVTGENHVFITGGVNLDVATSVVVTPTFIAKYDFNQFSWEAGGRATYNDKLYFGAGYRFQEAITGMVGGFPLKESKLRVGYAFDFTTFGVEAKTRTSHEIMVSYIFPKPVNTVRPPVKTPRYSF